MTIEPNARGNRDYLGFIDGLRAVAILAVVAYHVGIPAVRGGFFGVDVFFAISGFLIIGQILRASEEGRFSFGNFWARRVLRIVPSYLIVILASCLFAAFVLKTPDELHAFGAQTEWSAGMLVNWWLSGFVGYFNPKVAALPLAHLWSLSVEEQFYIVAPLVVAAFFLAARLLRTSSQRRVAALTMAAALAVWSLALALSSSDANATLFYQVLPRAWEFILGGLAWMLASWLRPSRSWVREIAAIAGSTMLLFALLGVRETAAFPSWQTLLPVCGACAIMWSSTRGETTISAALSWTPLRAIGLVSYGWYLWHWPLLAFGRLHDYGQLDSVTAIAAAVIALLLAVLTYRLVEQPIRTHRAALLSRGPWRLAALGVAGSLAVAAVGIGIDRIVAPGIEAASPEAFPAIERTRQDCQLESIAALGKCGALAHGEHPVLLLGDSHAYAASRFLETVAASADAGIVTIALPGCMPFLDTGRGLAVPAANDSIPDGICDNEQRRSLALLDTAVPRARAAILEAQWTFYTSDLRQLGQEPPADRRRGFEEAIGRTIDLLQAQGFDRILVIAPIPVFANTPADCVARASAADRDLRCAVPRQVVDAQRSQAAAWLGEALANRAGVVLVDPIAAVCDAQACRPYDGDTVLYSDYSHLGFDGLRRLYAAIKPGVDWLFAQD